MKKIFFFIATIGWVITVPTFGQDDFSHGKALMSSDPDSASFFFKKAKVTSIEEKDFNKYLLINLYDAIALQRQNKLSDELQVLAEGIKLIETEGPEDKSSLREFIGTHHYSIGRNFILRGNHFNAIPYLEKSSSILSEISTKSAKTNLLKTLSLLGQANQALRNKGRSLYYFNRLINEYDEDDHKNLCGVYNDKGNTFFVSHDFEKALSTYKEGLVHAREGKNLENETLILSNIAHAFLETGNTDSARFYIQESEDLIASVDNQILKAFYSRISGMLDLQLGMPSEAENNFLESITLLGKERKLSHTDVYMAHAKGLIDLGYFKRGIPLLLQAIETLIPEGTLYNDQLHADPFFLEAFSYLIQAERGLHKKENDPESLKRALYYAQLSNAVEDSLRTSLDYESSKMFLISESHERAEDAIEIALELYEITQDKVYIEKAFLFSERNHALLLLENINQLEAIAAADFSDNLRFEENKLRTNLIFARKTLKEKEIINDPELDLYRTIVFDAQEEYNALTQKLKASSPIYDQLSRTLTISTIQDLQRELSGTDQGIIQYFVGNEHTYGFLITENDIELKKLDLDVPLEEAVLAFRDGIMAAGRDPQLDLQYIQNAQKLYKGLIAPFEEALPLPKRMVIIPDGILGYVPFDALLTGNPDDNFNYSFFPYLMREYQISYAYSGSLWKKMLKAPEYQRPSEQYLAIAPVFKESEQYAYLQFSEEEVDYISKRLDSGRNLLFQEASKSSFLNILGNRLFKILHFSTHAEMNDEVPMDSHIVMSDNEQDHKLSLADLYAMRLNADMVVLAACETAGGKLQQGEGIISMARGFAYAGCRSLLASLWKVNHFSTSQIMQNYYASLYYGESKDHALQAARIEFLDTYKGINGHPFYWAAFTPIGNMEPVLKHPFWKYIGYLTGGGLVLIFLLFRLRKRFKK